MVNITKAYKVLKITELSRLSKTGGVEKFYQHQIETKGGVILTVDIDKSNFTPEKAAPILTQAAENADKILTS